MQQTWARTEGSLHSINIKIKMPFPAKGKCVHRQVHTNKVLSLLCVLRHARLTYIFFFFFFFDDVYERHSSFKFSISFKVT